MSGELDLYKETRKQLDLVSPSFCLAKWLQVTLHLHNGQTHSCHHPAPHHIPLAELKDDHTTLHNTEFKKDQQRMMIEGDKPNECQYCWNVEDLPGEQTSDRIMKSTWMIQDIPPINTALVEIDAIPKVVESMNLGESINPHYVEVSFSNVCNFKCSYCSPVYSSKWVSEISNHGPYYLTNREHNGLEWYKQNNEMPIHHTEDNPYVAAFWEWWPELVKTLKIFRITGGEPLLDKNTFKVMDMLEETPRPEMEFSINSNLGSSDAVIDNYISSIKSLLDQKKIKRHVLYTSVDGHGAQAEYGRNGLDYDKWLQNINKILQELPSVKIAIMCTANIFTITSYKRLLEDVYELKVKYMSNSRQMPLTIDTSILRWPHHQCAAILPNDYEELLDDAYNYALEREEANGTNAAYKGFFQFEIEKIRRFVEFAKNPPNENEGTNELTSKRDFYLFVNEHDRRRGTNFLETFPELTEFYEQCRTLNTNIIATG